MHFISCQLTSFQLTMNSYKPCLFFDSSAGHYLVCIYTGRKVMTSTQCVHCMCVSDLSKSCARCRTKTLTLRETWLSHKVVWRPGSPIRQKCWPVSFSPGSTCASSNQSRFLATMINRLPPTTCLFQCQPGGVDDISVACRWSHLGWWYLNLRFVIDCGGLEFDAMWCVWLENQTQRPQNQLQILIVGCVVFEYRMMLSYITIAKMDLWGVPNGTVDGHSLAPQSHWIHETLSTNNGGCCLSTTFTPVIGGLLGSRNFAARRDCTGDFLEFTSWASSAEMATEPCPRMSWVWAWDRFRKWAWFVCWLLVAWGVFRTREAPQTPWSEGSGSGASSLWPPPQVRRVQGREFVG